MKKFFLLYLLLINTNIAAEDQAITQWVYNALERAQANIDKGNYDAAERLYYDLANDSWGSKSYDHFVILRTFAYFLIEQNKNKEALKYLELAVVKKICFHTTCLN